MNSCYYLLLTQVVVGAPADVSMVTKLLLEDTWLRRFCCFSVYWCAEATYFDINYTQQRNNYGIQFQCKPGTFLLFLSCCIVAQ